MPEFLSSTSLEKQRLRAQMLARRKTEAKNNRFIYKQLAGILLPHLELEEGAVVAAYVPMGEEIDPVFILEALRAKSHPIALPVTPPRGQPLTFRLHRPDDPLAPNKMGILEPLPSAPLAEPDIVLVPLLAFDAARNRLGSGGGYYDRTLTALRSRRPINAIGIGYSFQQLPQIPVEPWDAKLDKIATELNIF